MSKLPLSKPTRKTLEAMLENGDIDAILELVQRAQRETADAQIELAEGARKTKEALEQADTLTEQVGKLTYQVKHLTRLLWGRRSERLTKVELAQLILAFDGSKQDVDGLTIPKPGDVDSRDEEVPENEQPSRKSRKNKNHPGRTALSETIERRIHDIEVPQSERACTQCGEEMGKMGYVEHEKVEFIPARFVVDVQRREKLGCKSKRCKNDAITAERQQTSNVTTRVGASVLAHLIESKCDDALPIYRQRDQFQRLGFEIPLNTLYGNWTYALDLLAPVAEVTLGCVLAEDIVCIDDTGMPVLDKRKPKGKFRGHLWGFLGNQTKLIAYQFTETWKADDIGPWIAAIDGFIQVDDYAGYSCVVETIDGCPIKLVPDERRLGCMMHVRRRFYDAFKSGDKRAGPAIEWIRRIYEVEAKAKKEHLGHDARHRLRQTNSVPVLAEFYAWVKTMEPTLGKTTKLAQAVRYALNQRVYVERCFTEGRFEIDNGAIERTLREPCLGRKNFLHAGSVAGAKRLATAYTLVQSCRALGISTRDYLIDVIEKIAGDWPMSRIRELVPDRWALEHATAATTRQTGE